MSGDRLNGGQAEGVEIKEEKFFQPSKQASYTQDVSVAAGTVDTADAKTSWRDRRQSQGNENLGGDLPIRRIRTEETNESRRHARSAFDDRAKTYPVPAGEKILRPQQLPNPFASAKSSQQGTVTNAKSAAGANTRAPPTWGVSNEDAATVDSFSDPEQAITTTVRRETKTKSVAAEPRASKSAAKTSRPATKPPQLPPSTSTPHLTHLTPTGEVHMVDVGAKPATRRVAIATSYVHFGNPEPFRLIFENSNKKGDVLSVARIAGIMAAKRASDLIPLCHPIVISKVEVDVVLTAPTVAHRSFTHGEVKVQVLVECVGATGVEMEALAGVSGAALTVYDMCKAVDREMKIRRTSVVYKSGGRSGTYVDPDWLQRYGGMQVLEAYGLKASTQPGPNSVEPMKEEG